MLESWFTSNFFHMLLMDCFQDHTSTAQPTYGDALTRDDDDKDNDEKDDADDNDYVNVGGGASVDDNINDGCEDIHDTPLASACSAAAGKDTRPLFCQTEGGRF